MTKDEIHVVEIEDLKSGICYTIAFECLSDFVEYVRFSNRALDVKWIDAAVSFGYTPLRFKEVEND